MLGLALTLLVVQMISTGGPTFVVDSHLFAHTTPMSAALREDVLRLTITRDGSVYFRNFRIANPDLPQQLLTGLRNGSERKVYLVVDSRAHYGDVQPVLDGIRGAGIQNIAFLAEQPYLHK